MWLSPERHAHSFIHFARVSRIPTINLRCFAIFEIPRTAFSHDPGSSRRNRQVDPWRWTPENT
eukprot:2012904-Pyramimonas_sp.AAC.1